VPVSSVLLVSTPFGSLDRPALGLGLLQAQLERAGVPCGTRHLGFAFADRIGADEYRWLAGDVPYTSFAGEWVFAASLSPGLDGSAYVREVLRGTWNLDERAVARILRIRAAVEPFLEACVAAPGWEGVDVVGFTSTFAQNVAALALATRLKARHPHLVTVLGGANVEGEMGEAVHAGYRAIDVVVSGEGDHTLPALVDAIGSGRDLAEVPGIVFRRGTDSVATGPAPLVQDLDALPPPDHAPFFADRARSTAAVGPSPRLLIETSRGCWWGAKQHCTFCGLNGGTMRFRSKSPDRVLDELRTLHRRYGIAHVDVVDNILDMHYFTTLLPHLADDADLDLRLFYEVKANLTLEQVQLLAAAGVRGIQPGIESLSDHVLELMNKGTTTLQNVQLLRWCEEQGVVAEWNLLYGFPGEDPADYDAMLPVIDAIDHLRPPSGLGPVRLDRFSPYHADPARHGIVDVRPMAVYRHLYDLPEHELARVACYFDFAYADGRRPLAYAAAVVDRIERWMASGASGRLTQREDGGRTVLTDTRPGSRGEVALTGWRAEVYGAADRVATLARLRGRADVPAEKLERFVDACVTRRLLLRTGDRVLALAVRDPARPWVRRAAPGVPSSTSGPGAGPPTSTSLVGHAVGEVGVASADARHLAEPLPLFGATPSGSR
jgi:ribosomal peptide maturation radical SAM protein 1